MLKNISFYQHGVDSVPLLNNEQWLPYKTVLTHFYLFWWTAHNTHQAGALNITHFKMLEFKSYLSGTGKLSKHDYYYLNII